MAAPSRQMPSQPVSMAATPQSFRVSTASALDHMLQAKQFERCCTCAMLSQPVTLLCWPAGWSIGQLIWWADEPLCAAAWELCWWRHPQRSRTHALPLKVVGELSDCMFLVPCLMPQTQ